jgi:hypothetical protein
VRPHNARDDVARPRGVHSEVSSQDAIGELRRHLGEVFRCLAEQKESRVDDAKAPALPRDTRHLACGDLLCCCSSVLAGARATYPL